MRLHILATAFLALALAAPAHAQKTAAPVETEPAIELVYRLTMSPFEDGYDAALAETAEVLSARAAALAGPGVSMRILDATDIVLALPRVDDMDYVRANLSLRGGMSLHEAMPPELAPASTAFVMMSLPDGQDIVIRREAAMTGDMVRTVSAQRSDHNPELSLLIRFNNEGARRFCEVTEEAIGGQLAIVVDGEAVSAPRIMERICAGSAMISGQFTLEEIGRLAKAILRPRLNHAVILVEERLVARD